MGKRRSFSAEEKLRIVRRDIEVVPRSPKFAGVTISTSAGDTTTRDHTRYSGKLRLSRNARGLLRILKNYEKS